MIFVPDGKAVGLASIAKQTDKKGEIAKQSLADKVEAKKHKGEKKIKKGEATKQEGKEKVEEVKDVPAPVVEGETKEEAPKAEGSS